MRLRWILVAAALPSALALATVIFGRESAPDSIRPPLPPPQGRALASCTDARGDAAAGFDLASVDVRQVASSVFWHFSYDGPKPTTSMEWSSLSSTTGKQYVLQLGPDGAATAQFVRDPTQVVSRRPGCPPPRAACRGSCRI